MRDICKIDRRLRRRSFDCSLTYASVIRTLPVQCVSEFYRTVYQLIIIIVIVVLLIFTTAFFVVCWVW